MVIILADLFSVMCTYCADCEIFPRFFLGISKPATTPCFMEAKANRNLCTKCILGVGTPRPRTRHRQRDWHHDLLLYIPLARNAASHIMYFSL